MKKLVILGDGTAGIMMLYKLHLVLNKEEWQKTIVNQYEILYYQPGFLFIQFGIYINKDFIKPKRNFFPPDVEDVKHLGTNIATILNTVKAFTQLYILHSNNNAVHVYKNLNIEMINKISIFSFMIEINTPEFKNDKAFAVQFFKNIANQEITKIKEDQNN